MNFCINTQELLDRLMTASNLFAFKTTAKVVMEASNLHLEAIKAIGREYGVDIKDPEGRCIDENLLDKLADAHVRQLKSYFNHTKRHLNELTGAELAAFVDFCETFKERQTTNHTALTWNDIDESRLRRQFIRKVHELTPENHNVPSLFGGLIDLNYLLRYRSEYECDANKQHEDFVIDRVLKSYWHYIPSQIYRNSHLDNRPCLRRFTIPGRYHVFVGEEDHLVA